MRSGWAWLYISVFLLPDDVVASRIVLLTFCLVLFVVCSDEDTTRLKGKTLMNEQERAEQVLHCRYVDQVVVRSPWVLTQEFLDEYQIDFVVHGEDNSYDDQGNDAYDFVKKQGKYKTIKRTDGVSTTDLIIRILKDYNGYVERCMRRGFTHQDLNIAENVWVRNLHGINMRKASKRAKRFWSLATVCPLPFLMIPSSACIYCAILTHYKCFNVLLLSFYSNFTTE